MLKTRKRILQCYTEPVHIIETNDKETEGNREKRNKYPEQPEKQMMFSEKFQNNEK